MNSEIYQQIWDADQAGEGNGIPAIRHGAPKPDDGGFVEVNEIESADAEHRLFTHLALPESKKHTYSLCERLFDNYSLDPGIREQITSEESAEETDFIETVVATPPLQVAKEIIAFDRDEPVASISDSTLAGMVREAWFFQGLSGSKHASGFEHIFVGEQKPKGDVRDSSAVAAGGYHFWYKYFLDDAGGRLDGGAAGIDRITYAGTRYGGADSPEQGILVPEVVTLSFQWEAPDLSLTDPGKTQLLTKPIGGFWVGCSPEALVALGLVRALTRAGKIAKINGVTYQLDLHRLSDNPRSIRTFFPRFKKADFSGIEPAPPSGPGAEPVDGPPSAEPAVSPHSVQIVASLVNPAGPEAGRESVTLVNGAPTPVDLNGWSLQAPNGTRFTLAENLLPAGEAIRLRLPTPSPVLRNRAGTIRLFNAGGDLMSSVDYSTEQAQREASTIIF